MLVCVCVRVYVYVCVCTDDTQLLANIRLTEMRCRRCWKKSRALSGTNPRLRASSLQLNPDKNRKNMDRTEKCEFEKLGKGHELQHRQLSIDGEYQPP